MDISKINTNGMVVLVTKDDVLCGEINFIIASDNTDDFDYARALKKIYYYDRGFLNFPEIECSNMFFHNKKCNFFTIEYFELESLRKKYDFILEEEEKPKEKVKSGRKLKTGPKIGSKKQVRNHNVYTSSKREYTDSSKRETVDNILKTAGAVNYAFHLD